MLPQWKKYRTHVDVVGASQTGKTSFAAYCRRKRFLKRKMVVSLDYKSGGFRQDVAFIAEACPNLPVKIINASQIEGHAYNPFRLPDGSNLSAHVSRVAENVLRTVSRQPISELQQYAETAVAFFAHLAVSGEPIADAMRLFEFGNRQLWLTLSGNIPHPELKWQMERVAGIDAKNWEFQVGALRRRLRPFAVSDSLRRVMSAPNPIDFDDCFRNSVSILVNATPSDYLYPEDGKILLGLVFSDLLRLGLLYADDPHDCEIHADEIEEYATEDLGSVLDLILSSGMRLVAIHHFKGQLPERSRESLEKNARVKIVFGGATPQEIRDYAALAFPSQMARRWRKQPRLSTFTDYDEEDTQSITESNDDRVSITKAQRLRPIQEQIVSGWDDFSMEEKLAKLSTIFLVPDRVCVAILPDKKLEIIQVPTLRRYLYDSAECLKFRETLPQLPDDHGAKRVHRLKTSL